ncbi:hypothetical protein BDL97_03G046800 [Sphagnum fallax]|nr:hypothetical protein BDL97_03G046800 [Sphagnum fallax]
MTCEMGRGLSMESTRDQAAMRSGLFWEDPTTDQGACGGALLSLQSNAHPSSSPSLHGFYGGLGSQGMAQDDMQQYAAAAASTNHNILPTCMNVDGSTSAFELSSSTFAVKPSSRGQQLLWCPGIQSDAASAREYYSVHEELWSKNNNHHNGGWAQSIAASSCIKPEMEMGVEGGVLVVRSQACPWSRLNLDSTNRFAATDPLRYHKLLVDAFSFMDDHVQQTPSSEEARIQGGTTTMWCKHCALLEKNLFYMRLNPAAAAEEIRPAADDIQRFQDDTNSFKQVVAGSFFSDRDFSYSNLDTRKRKEELNQEYSYWESSDRARVLWKMRELTNRANRAEQRVMELEQLLREHAVMTHDDATSVDSELIAAPQLLPQRESFEARSEQLVCKLPGCNKLFKSSKTLRRHVVQKHSDNARFLACNQPTVNGVICRFETIHSGVLSYHRKHSLAHQRREDWHICCPFCQSKFARQHEMDRHQRICKSRPHQQEAAPAAAASLQQSTAVVHMPAMLSISDQLPLGPNLSDQLQQQHQNSVDTGSHHHYHHHHHLQLLVPGNNHNIVESEGT